MFTLINRHRSLQPSSNVYCIMSNMKYNVSQNNENATWSSLEYLFPSITLNKVFRNLTLKKDNRDQFSSFRNYLMKIRSENIFGLCGKSLWLFGIDRLLAKKVLVIAEFLKAKSMIGKNIIQKHWSFAFLFQRYYIFLY